MKKWFAFLLVLALCFGLLAGCGTTGTEDPEAESEVADLTTFRIASLKGPTTMGMVKLMNDAEEGAVKHDYQFEIFGTADEVVPKLVNGDLDIALVPCNLASVLYNKTQGLYR